MHNGIAGPRSDQFSDAWHRGNCKTTPNSVVASDADGVQIGVVFETSTPFDPPRLMNELLTWMQDEAGAMRFYPLLRIGMWAVFFLRSLAEQVRRLETKLERERLVLAPLPKLSLQIVEFAREHGRVRMGDAIRLTGASRNTLKQQRAARPCVALLGVPKQINAPETA